MKRIVFLIIFLGAALASAGCGGGAKKEASAPTATAAAAESTTTTAAAETTITTAAATTTTTGAAAPTGQALKDGFSVVSGTTLYKIEDTKENTVGNTVYSGWKAQLDLTGDLNAIADAFIGQVKTNGYQLLPEDKGTNEQEGHKFSYRSFVGVKEIPSTKGVGGKRTTDRVTINVIKSDSGSGQVTIDVEHMRYTD